MVKITDISFLPKQSGCYLFKNKEGAVIYVGKAKNVRKRAANYFQKKEHDPKTAALIKEIKEIDCIVTSSELDALLLENNLIKRYYPRYNLDLKDSRRYAYIMVHNDEFPWIEVVRQREKNGEYYGPFVSGAMRKIVLDVISRNFRILTKKPSSRLKKIINKQEYFQRMQHAKRILKGDVEELISELKDQMNMAAVNKYYEHALTRRNQIEALVSLKEKQLMEMTRKVDAHIINYKKVGDMFYLLVFFIRNGVLEEKQSYNFPYYEDCFEDFLSQYYDSAPVPHELIIPHAVNPIFKLYLSKKAQRLVSIIVPQKGDKKELLDLVEYNITTTFFTGSEHITALQEILHLEKLPKNIECFDISHLGGTNIVASMVRFNNGLPEKKSYRKFKMRFALTNDDYAAMREVIKRRYAGTLKYQLRNPDLIIVDGGKGQLHAAHAVLKELKLSIPIIALAKREEEIYTLTDQKPLHIERKNKGLQLLQSMRDEAHRFALSYQRLLRDKSFRKK